MDSKKALVILGLGVAAYLVLKPGIIKAAEQASAITSIVYKAVIPSG